ncbi:hypothetical protein MMC28_007448 [Mycoblastus sanguinarius]|nr:hypothetical protein [Mycoblastus sanguinarius]
MSDALSAGQMAHSLFDMDNGDFDWSDPFAYGSFFPTPAAGYDMQGVGGEEGNTAHIRYTTGPDPGHCDASAPFPSTHNLPALQDQSSCDIAISPEGLIDQGINHDYFMTLEEVATNPNPENGETNWHESNIPEPVSLPKLNIPPDAERRYTNSGFLRQEAVDSASTIAQPIRQSTSGLQKECTCPFCRFDKYWKRPMSVLSMENFVCDINGCKEKLGWFHGPIMSHIVEHFTGKGNFTCIADNCKFATKRWVDTTRHHKVKHCMAPNKFFCSEIGCKYSEIGFARKDKLKSHQDNVHKGMLRPGQAGRAIRPKTNGAA